MAYLDPTEAATLARGAWAEGQPEKALTTFSIDSRVLEPGETFIALKTEHRDGHAFLGEAIARGALAAMVQEPDHRHHLPQLVVENTWDSLHSMARVWRQRFKAPVLAITGSFGKTTVKEMLGTVMGSQWFRTRGNLNNTLGVPLSVLELNPRHDAGAILEAGINMPGEMEVLADIIDPDLVIISAIGPSHLEQLGNLDGVAREKSILAKALRPGGVAVVSVHLLRYAAFRELPETVEVHAIAVGPVEEDLQDLADRANIPIFPYNWTETTEARGMGSLLSGDPMPAGEFPFLAGSPGMISNLALVVHTALHLGVPVTTLQACLEGWRPFLHRGETYRDGERLFYVDCYNANPGSMVDSVIRFKNLFADQPHLYVLGSMNELGNSSRDWHRITGENFNLPEGAMAFLMGPGADWMREGLVSSGFPEASISVAGDLDMVRKRIRKFSGAVFLKASRSYGLEQLLPEGAERC